MESATNSRRNFYAFIWHALFLAFVATFIDVNTVLASFILKIGGTSIHVGILTGISIGLPMITQLLFAGFLASRSRKKPFLLLGIYLRVLALFGLGYTLSISDSGDPMRLLLIIFFWIGIFSISGAFAGISYTDILGKTLPRSQRRLFLIFRQFISSSGMLASALVVRHLVTAFPYPENYTVIFMIASLLLFVAAIGFLMIKEDAGNASHFSGAIRTIKAMPWMLRTDANLKNYIFLINLTSLGITLIPFYVAFSKSLFGLTRNQIGNFVFLQFLGMILSTLIWNWIAKRFKYKGIAFSCIFMGGLLPLTALFLSRYGTGIYQWVFFFAGFIISAGRISFEGILLEITNNDNRAIYAGISGTLSLTTAFFPIMAGVLIETFGFNVIFFITPPLVMIALLFIRRIKCSTSDELRRQ